MGLGEFLSRKKRAKALADKAVALYNMHGTTDGNYEFHEVYQSIPQGEERRRASEFIAKDAAVKGDWEVARWMGGEAKLPNSDIIEHHGRAKFALAQRERGRKRRTMRTDAADALAKARQLRSHGQ